MRRRFLLLTLRLVPAIAVVVVSVLQAGARLGVWQKDSTRDFWILVAAAAVIFLRSVWDAARSFASESRAAKGTGYEKVIVGLLESVSADTPLDPFDLAVSVFDRRLIRRSRLRRVYRIRLNSQGYGPKIAWAAGKGAVGTTLQTGEDTHLNLAAARRNYGAKAPMSDEQWAKVPLKYRTTFSREEFHSMVNRYAEVLAVPVVAPETGKIVGVLSVDVWSRSKATGVGALLDVSRVHEAATRVSNIISGLWAQKE